MYISMYSFYPAAGDANGSLTVACESAYYHTHTAMLLLLLSFHLLSCINLHSYFTPTKRIKRLVDCVER